MEPAALTTAVKAEAHHLGFDLVGVCPAVSPTGVEKFNEWLAAGHAGEMDYLPRRAAAYEHPSHVLDGVRSIVMLATVYRTQEPRPTLPGQGRVSCYAWGTDYHDLLHERLKQLAEFVLHHQPAAKVRGVVDTAPLLEREFAQLAGLGWIGKNTLLLNKQLGSWFFLAALLTDIELEPDRPHETDHCGTCTACLEACPTDAFVAPYVLDSRKCISYLTIELRSAIPHALREGVGEWLFGCDVCQDVCPWNHRAAPTDEPAFQSSSGMNPIDLVELFDLDDVEFRARFRHSPLWRAKRRGVLRNAAIVLGNRPTLEGLTALIRGLQDEEPLVRGASAWALGRYDTEEAAAALCRRLEHEPDADVSSEIAAALASDQDPSQSQFESSGPRG